MFSEFVSLFFPRNCTSCSTALNESEQFICIKCKLSLPFTDDLQNPENDLFKKFAYEPKISTAAAYMYFNVGGVSQKILHKIKYGNGCDMATYIGTMMATDMQSIFENIDFILPVPIHQSKMKTRGYNQSMCLAKGVSDTYDIPIEENLIRREKKTATQTKKTKVDRWKNIENVYSSPTLDVSDKNALIIDDVITTGSTVGQLVERLSLAGINEVRVICLARGK